MKETKIKWIETIPEDWNLCKIKYLFHVGTGRNISDTELDYNGLYPVYSSQTINDGCMGYINTYDFDLDQLTWTMDGIYAGTVFIRHGKHTCTNACGTLQLKDPKNDLRYMKYALEYTTVYYKRPGINGAKIPNHEMEEIKIAVPPIKEQWLIANLLDQQTGKIYDILSDLEKQIQILQKYKQSLIMQIVSGGLHSNCFMQKSGIDWIGDIPAHWKTRKIKTVATLARGTFKYRPRNASKLYGGNCPFIQTGDVANANKYITNYSQTLSEFGITVSKKYPKGTIVLTLAAHVGNVAILSFESCFPDSILAIKPYPGVDSVYFYYILSAMKEEFKKNTMINTQSNLNIERVGNLKIPITFDEKEQKEIVLFLDQACEEIDSVIAGKRTLITKIKQYKKTVLYEYVTGKKRCK